MPGGHTDPNPNTDTDTDPDPYPYANSDTNTNTNTNTGRDSDAHPLSYTRRANKPWGNCTLIQPDQTDVD